MRLTLIRAFIVGTLLFIAPAASAISLFLGTPSEPGPQFGAQFSITLSLDTEGETDITSLFASVVVDPFMLAFMGGTSPGSILFDPNTFEALQRYSQPYVLGSDPAGLVRAATFAGLGPSGVASDNQLLATLTFQVVGPGLSSISVLLASGDDITVNGASVAGAVSFGP